MLRSRYPRLFAAASCLALISLWVFTAACGSDDDDPEGPMLQASCASMGYRETRFRNWDQNGITVFDAEHVCALGRSATSVGLGCFLVEWDVPNEGDSPSELGGNPGSNTFFHYQQGEDACVRFFMAELDYTRSGVANTTHNRYRFTGGSIRDFDSGSGPFAIGTWEELDANFNVLRTGCFDFYEDEHSKIPLTPQRVCQLP